MQKKNNKKFNNNLNIYQQREKFLIYIDLKVI